MRGADEKEPYFTHCHITLDSFTLEWYNKNGGKEAQNEWSNIGESEYKKIHPKDNFGWTFYFCIVVIWKSFGPKLS